MFAKALFVFLPAEGLARLGKSWLIKFCCSVCPVCLSFRKKNYEGLQRLSVRFFSARYFAPAARRKSMTGKIDNIHHWSMTSVIIQYRGIKAIGLLTVSNMVILESLLLTLSINYRFNVNLSITDLTLTLRFDNLKIRLDFNAHFNDRWFQIIFFDHLEHGL